MNTYLSNLPGFRDFFFLVAAICAVTAIAGITPIFTADTGSYLEGHFFREPGYPFVMQTAMTIAGSAYATVLVILQQLAGILAAYLLCAFLRERFELPYWLFCLITVIVLSPYFTVHTGKLGNTIQSEGITYPLFLLALRLLLMSLADVNTKAFAAYIYVLTLLLLSRSQFLIFIPASLFCLGYFAFIASQKKQAAGLLVLFLFALLVSNTIIKANNYVSYGIFASPPTTFQQMLIAPLYLAKETDATLFETTEERELFQQVFRKMKEKKAHTSFFSPAVSRHVEHFTNSYNRISWQSLYPLGLAQYTSAHPDTSTFAAAIALDNTFRKMSFTLIHANFTDWFIFFVQNIKYGTFDLHMLAALCIIVCVGMIRRPNGFPLLAFTIVLLHLTNLVAISLVEPTIPRYTFYTGICMQLLIILCVAKVLGCGRIHHGTTKGHA